MFTVDANISSYGNRIVFRGPTFDNREDPVTQSDGSPKKFPDDVQPCPLACYLRCFAYDLKENFLNMMISCRKRRHFLNRHCCWCWIPRWYRHDFKSELTSSTNHRRRAWGLEASRPASTLWHIWFVSLGMFLVCWFLVWIWPSVGYFRYEPPSILYVTEPWVDWSQVSTSASILMTQESEQWLQS